MKTAFPNSFKILATKTQAAQFITANFFTTDLVHVIPLVLFVLAIWYEE